MKTKGKTEVQLEQVTDERTTAETVRHFVISSKKQVFLVLITLGVNPRNLKTRNL